MSPLSQKVTAAHLRRPAFLYVRQSTLRQVFENAESTRRQYALRERAVALGWPPDRVVVIDSDLGQSGASADREGFRRLVAEVGMGRAGIVLGLEVSRLARNSADWHRLLELCALTDTLILDEDGIYCPGDFNDRLLLGLKGTMSEAELHFLRARLRGGIMNRARRGELRIGLPVGLIYDPRGRVVLDPDTQVQESLRLLFDAFERAGSAGAVVRLFRVQGLLFPRRPRYGPRRGELLWESLERTRVLRALKSPRYAGAFAFGRTRQRRSPGGGAECRRRPREEWDVLLIDAHPGYISWERFEANQRQLAECAATFGADRRGPPREGPALLQGLAVCGVCGQRMTVRYHTRRGRQVPDYLCQRRQIETATAPCQRIPGAGIDRAVGKLLVELVSPMMLETAVRVQDELAARADQADALRARRAQRAREEADLARRRFLRADPDNRLVAAALEADWNARLAEEREALEDLERRRDADHNQLDEAQRRKIFQLAADFPRLWNDPKTPDREKKRMARLLLEDVTLTRNGDIALGVRLRGGAVRRLTLAPERPAWELRQTPAAVVAEIDALLDEHNEAEVAAILNARGRRSGTGGPFHARRVAAITGGHHLKSHFQRLRTRGWLTSDEMAASLAISTSTVRIWRRAGLLRALPYAGTTKFLYEPPGDQPPEKHQGRRLSRRQRFPHFEPYRPSEVQSDA